MARSRPAARLRAALVAGATAALAAALLAAPPAFGHAALVGASPAPGARVEDPPRQVVLVFSEPLEPRLSTAALVRAGGGEASARPAVRGRRLVLTPRAPLRRGAWLVRWRTVSTDDAHPLEGAVGFGVRVPAAAGGTVEESPLAGTGWVRALARAGLYAALVLLAGGLLARALLGTHWPARRPSQASPPFEDPPRPPEPAGDRDAPAGNDGPAGAGPATAVRPPPAAAVAPAPPPDPAVRARAEQALADAGLATVAFGAAVATLDAARAADDLSAAALRDYLLAGVPGIARIALIVLAGVAMALVRRAPRAAALAAAGAVGCVAVSGHARSAAEPELAVLADYVHLLAGAVWLGGAALIVLAWGRMLGDRTVRADVVREVLPAFGRIALPAFVVVALAGTLNAAIELERPSDLWRTSYGGVLAGKVALVAAAAGAAAVHAFWLRPRLAGRGGGPAAGGRERWHWRALRSEAVLGAGVVAAAGLLVAFPLPPRQLDAVTAGAGRVVACDPCPLPAPRGGELSVADQAGTRVVAAWVRRRGTGLAGTVRALDFRGRPAVGALVVPGARMRPCGRGCLEFSLTPAPARLEVAVTERGRGHRVLLPVRWRAGDAARARRLLARAEGTMRALRSVREFERTSSGPGMVAVTRYVMRAPDRLAYETDRGVRTIQIGSRQWRRFPGGPWVAGQVPGGAPFRTRGWFRWTPYARAVELLSERGGRAELALTDPTTPVWVRLIVDTASGRVLRERLVAPARLIEHRFGDFDGPARIEPPPGAVRGG